MNQRTDLDRPPQTHAKGERRALDRRWLEYLRQQAEKLAGPPLELRDLTPPSPMSRAVAQWNAGEFTASHETWEELWRDAAYPVRLFYLAMAKLSAGLEQARRGSSRGARRLATDALGFLDPLPASFLGMDIAHLKLDIQRSLAQGGDSSGLKLVRLHPAP